MALVGLWHLPGVAFKQNMEKTTRNIIYLYNNIAETVLACKGNIDEETFMVIGTTFVPKFGEVFNVTIQQAQFPHLKNMYRLRDFVVLDEEALLEGIEQYVPDPVKVAPIIDEWFQWNK